MCPFSHPFLSLSIFHLPFSHLDPNSPLLVNDISPRRAGEDHRTRQQNKLMAFHLRRGSTPPLIGGNNRYGSVAGQMTILYTIYMLSYSLSLFSTFLNPLLSSVLSCPPPAPLILYVPQSSLLLASSLFHFSFSLSHSSHTSFDQSDGHQLSERGRYLSPGSGIRASRSYDLLTDAIHDDYTDRGEVFSSSFHGRDNTPFMSYGISPRL